MNPDRKPLFALTGARFFAASWVVLYHNLWLAGDGIPVWLTRVASHGHLAVSFFFLLSGFILTYTYAGTTWRGSSKSTYFINRFARIYPVYFLSFLADAPRAIHYFSSTYSAPEAIWKSVLAGVSYLTLTQSWLPRMASAWNSPGWSLSDEVFFYVLFPTLVVGVCRLERRRSVAAFGLAVYAISLFFNVCSFAAAQGGPTWLQPFFNYFPPLYLGDFILGMITARLLILSPSLQDQRAAMSFGLTAGGLAIVFGCALGYPEIPVICLHAIVAPGFALVVISLAQERNPIACFLAAPPLVILGGSSYAVYLLHQPIVCFVTSIVGVHRGIGVFALYVSAVIVLSIAVFLFIEEPAHRWLRNQEHFGRRRRVSI